VLKEEKAKESHSMVQRFVDEERIFKHESSQRAEICAKGMASTWAGVWIINCELA
jgi:hypothetical protein